MSIGTIVASRTGFFYGWWVVFASATIVFLTGGTFFYGFGALFNPIVNEFGWSRASISLAFSLRTEVGGIAAPIVGFAVDRVGARRLMVFGVLFVALGFVLLSRVQDLPAFYGAVVVIAMGMSATAGPVGMVAIAHWFSSRRGRALAFMTIGAGTSGVMVLVLELADLSLRLAQRPPDHRRHTDRGLRTPGPQHPQPARGDRPPAGRRPAR